MYSPESPEKTFHAVGRCGRSGRNDSAGRRKFCDYQFADRILESETTTSYSYIYANGKLLQEKVTTNGVTETHNFFYDNTGKPYAMQVNGTTYYYITNLQGDVMGLVDTSGNSVASYTYDPYGKVLTATGALAEKNPLRYRGYYYDSESGLYYLQSRYYDPATRRFINADSYAGTGQGLIGYNMYAYCNNNAVNYKDSLGNEAVTITVVTIAGAAFVVAVLAAVVKDCCYYLAEAIYDAGVWITEQTQEVWAEISYSKREENAEVPEVPDVTYPGDDPKEAPDGTEWRGAGEQGGKQGNYYNPDTGESWHPDLEHEEPIGPHWDYRDPAGTWWRVFFGDNVMPK